MTIFGNDMEKWIIYSHIFRMAWLHVRLHKRPQSSQISFCIRNIVLSSFNRKGEWFIKHIYVLKEKTGKCKEKPHGSIVTIIHMAIKTPHLIYLRDRTNKQMSPIVRWHINQQNLWLLRICVCTLKIVTFIWVQLKFSKIRSLAFCASLSLVFGKAWHKIQLMNEWTIK